MDPVGWWWPTHSSASVCFFFPIFIIYFKLEQCMSVWGQSFRNYWNKSRFAIRVLRLVWIMRFHSLFGFSVHAPKNLINLIDDQEKELHSFCFPFIWKKNMKYHWDGINRSVSTVHCLTGIHIHKIVIDKITTATAEVIDCCDILSPSPSPKKKKLAQIVTKLSHGQ